MFLPVLPIGAHRPEADLPNPLRSLDSLPHPKKLPPAPVIASQPHDFNIPDLTGTVCPGSSAGPESGHSAAVRRFLTSTLRCPARPRPAVASRRRLTIRSASPPPVMHGPRSLHSDRSRSTHHRHPVSRVRITFSSPCRGHGRIPSNDASSRNRSSACPTICRRPHIVARRHEIRVPTLDEKRIDLVHDLAHQVAHLVLVETRHFRPGNAPALGIDHNNAGCTLSITKSELYESPKFVIPL